MFFQDVRKNAMQAYMKHKAYYDLKKPMRQNLNKLITFTSYSQKQITRNAKLFLQVFGGLDLILLKRCYETVIIWYAKLAPIGRKYFIERGYANSHPATYSGYTNHNARMANRPGSYH